MTVRRRARPGKGGRPAPAGPVVDLVIEAVGARGDGVADHDGRRVFVGLTVPGDHVRVRLGPPRGEGIAADLIGVLAPGPSRAEPVCGHFGRCGGCTLQHVAPEAYADWKRDQVLAALDRVGLGSVPVDAVVPASPGDRRRVGLAAARRGGRIDLGFNARYSHRLVDLDACPVMRPELVALLPGLRGLLARVLPDGGTADIAVSVRDDGPDVLIRSDAPLGLAERECLAAFAAEADLARLSWAEGADRRPEPVAHRRSATVRFARADVAVAVPPGGFLQATAPGEAALVEAVLSATAGADLVADLFAGSGTFTFPLATRTAVHAVEGDGEAADVLAATARGLPAVTVERRDLFASPLPREALSRFGAVVFDPPRAGARAQAGELAASSVPTVVGVSCNPATFARDARILTDGGYRLDRVRPVDQFLWSAHVELVGIFRRS